MSKRRVKCLLSKAEIHKLRRGGKSIQEIADIAGVSKSCIQLYLDPEMARRNSRNFYRRLEGNKRQRYINKQKRWANNSQKLSLILKARQARGGIEWTTEEIEYLQENAKTKTAIQIAIELKRTFYSVKSAAKRYGISLK